jgi:hypothetical protein
MARIPLGKELWPIEVFIANVLGHHMLMSASIGTLTASEPLRQTAGNEGIRKFR